MWQRHRHSFTGETCSTWGSAIARAVCAAMALNADELVDLAAKGDAQACAPLLCRELALSRSRYHELLIRLRDERAMLQVGCQQCSVLTKEVSAHAITCMVRRCVHACHSV